MNQKDIFADLHLHSTASDGILTPSELVKTCYRSGLKAIALTDHDTVKGVDEASETAEKLGMTFVTGIELSCGMPDQDYSLHVIGLFLDRNTNSLVELLKKHEEARRMRAFKILDLLESLKVNVAPLRADFESQQGVILARPHIARYLLANGFVKDYQEAFDKYLKKGCPAYVPKLHLAPGNGINAIHEAKGLAFIAHPGLDQNWDTTYSNIKDLPWDGIEVYYGDHDPNQTEKFRKLAENRRWLVSGGSDYHGESGKHVGRLGQTGLTRTCFKYLSVAAKKAAEAKACL
ncbi:MAG: PHP domain-containing protein [Candidatus Riflebacteria bacterium]|nr:PHP domain-containing protein [Candidatus Riflebacteria bacterium]